MSLDDHGVERSPSGRTAKVAANGKGRDFVVGDVHGHFDALRHLLDGVGFSLGVDRLFSVGDLIDRGPQSEEAVEWIEAGRIALTVMGNHEEMMLMALTEPSADDAEAYACMSVGEREALWFGNGGRWWESLFWDAERSDSGQAEAVRDRWLSALHGLPYAATVETVHGDVGIIHSCPLMPDWPDAVDLMENGSANARSRAVWTRIRAYGANYWERIVDHAEGDSGLPLPEGRFAGVRAVTVGHSPVKQVGWDANLLNLDAGVYRHGQLAMAEITADPIKAFMVSTELPEDGVREVDLSESPSIW